MFSPHITRYTYSNPAGTHFGVATRRNRVLSILTLLLSVGVAVLLLPLAHMKHATRYRAIYQHRHVMHHTVHMIHFFEQAYK